MSPPPHENKGQEINNIVFKKRNIKSKNSQKVND